MQAIYSHARMQRTMHVGLCGLLGASSLLGCQSPPSPSSYWDGAYETLRDSQVQATPSAAESLRTACKYRDVFNRPDFVHWPSPVRERAITNFLQAYNAYHQSSLEEREQLPGIVRSTVDVLANQLITLNLIEKEQLPSQELRYVMK